MRMTRDGYSARSRSLSDGKAVSVRGGELTEANCEDESMGTDVVGEAA